MFVCSPNDIAFRYTKIHAMRPQTMANQENVASDISDNTHGALPEHIARHSMGIHWRALSIAQAHVQSLGEISALGSTFGLCPGLARTMPRQHFSKGMPRLCPQYAETMPERTCERVCDVPKVAKMVRTDQHPKSDCMKNTNKGRLRA